MAVFERRVACSISEFKISEKNAAALRSPTKDGSPGKGGILGGKGTGRRLLARMIIAAEQI